MKKWLYKGGSWLLRGTWAICSFKRGLVKKSAGGVFERSLIPQCTLCTHHNIADLVNHGMVKSTKLEYLKNRASLFYKIKKFTCLRWKFVGSYCFVGEATFYLQIKIINATQFKTCPRFIVSIKKVAAVNNLVCFDSFPKVALSKGQKFLI